MTRLAALSLLVLVLCAVCGACADSDRTECEIAQATLDKCDAERAATTSAASFQRLPLQITGECSGQNACAASCINATSCAGINWVLRGGQNDPNSSIPNDAFAFNGCLQKCIELGR